MKNSLDNSVAAPARQSYVPTAADELKNTLIYYFVLGGVIASVMGINYLFSKDALPSLDPFVAFIGIALLVTPTCDLIYIRIGNTIQGHKFYAVWLIEPILNAIAVVVCTYFAYQHFFTTSRLSEEAPLLIVMFMMLACFSPTLTVSREEPENYSLESPLFSFKKRIYMSKKKAAIYRTCAFIICLSLSFTVAYLLGK